MVGKGFFPQEGEGAEGRPSPLLLFWVLHMQRAAPELLWQRTSINVCCMSETSPGLPLGKREGRRKSCMFWGGDKTHLYPPVAPGESLLLSVASPVSHHKFCCSTPISYFLILFPSCGCVGGSEPFLECWQASDNIPAGRAFPRSFLGNTAPKCPARSSGEERRNGDSCFGIFSPP